jgi:hypothetical protein
MNIKQKKFTSILLFVLVVFVLSCFYVYTKNIRSTKVETETSAIVQDRPSYTDLSTLTNESDAVFIGEVEKIEGTRNLAKNPQDPSKEDENIYVEGVDYRVNILEYLKGNDNNQVIVTEQKQLRLEKDKPLVKDEHYIGLNPKETYVFFAKKSPKTGKYFSAGDPFFFEIKNNTVKILTNEKNLLDHFKDKGLDEFKAKVKEAK